MLTLCRRQRNNHWLLMFLCRCLCCFLFGRGHSLPWLISSKWCLTCKVCQSHPHTVDCYAHFFLWISAYLVLAHESEPSILNPAYRALIGWLVFPNAETTVREHVSNNLLNKKINNLTVQGFHMQESHDFFCLISAETDYILTYNYSLAC